VQHNAGQSIHNIYVMNPPPSSLVIATRESKLALWQAHHIADRLRALYPQCEVHLSPMTTRGDQILDRTLSKVGGKGLFIKELEIALLEGRADLAVHSLKDVPMQLEPAFALAAITEREDPRDALVGQPGLAALPAGTVVGTSSLRRQAMVLANYPQLIVQPLRGNLDTRLAKLDRGDYAAILLAAAGLKRLGYAQRIARILPTEEFLPAAGQGALGIETLATRSDVIAALAPLIDQDTAACVVAERAVSRALGGSCTVPLAAFAQTEPHGRLLLRACVAQPDGKRQLFARGEQQAGELPEALGQRVAQQLLDQGAAQLLNLPV
jgi:hydroxymethylbilane synthase